MAYNSFKKIAQLSEKFGINHSVIAWLPKNITRLQVSQTLMEALSDALSEALGTEKAKSEYIVVPILKELRKQNPNTFSSFSGYQFDVDAKLKLTGFCDFILTATPNQMEIDAPIFCLVEAKNDNVEKGIAQCGAEMYAAKLFNERQGKPRNVIFGCVTTAFSWAFLKLENQTLYIDPNYVPLSIDEPQRVVSVLQWILDESKIV